MNKKTFYIVPLGCDKNNVDADSMAQLLINAGYRPVASAREAYALIVNTCGFIDTAKAESYGELAKLAKRKKPGQVLIAAGCLAQRYGLKVSQRVSGIDAVLGTRRWMDVLDVIESSGPSIRKASHDEPDVLRVSIQGASAYLKIADGCSRTCAYCAIPGIKGPAASRPIKSILKEARAMQDEGIKELVLIAQNTTDYGHDMGMKNGLAVLLKEIAKAAPEIPWIRIMYAFPGFVTDELIEVMAAHKQIVPYLDMPLQHAHPDVLKRMARPANIDWVYKTVEKMRKAIPGLTLRSTFITGYCGETEEEFQTLLDFISEIKFDKLGAIKYSHESGTPAEPLGDTVPDEVKEDRLRRLMEKQQEISLALNRGFVGKTLDVLIEGHNKGISVGRSYRDAPKVDGLVLVKGELAAGQIYPVRIDKAMVYDLSGSVIM